MARVVPSDVVAALDAMFPFASTQQVNTPRSLTMGNSTSLAALARLVDEIPPQLLTLTSADYITFIHLFSRTIPDRLDEE